MMGRILSIREMEHVVNKQDIILKFSRNDDV